MTTHRSLAALLIAAAATATFAGDWPMWGSTPQRNMVSHEKNVPFQFDPGKYKQGGGVIDMATSKGVKWVAKMGSETYGNPVVAGGLVYVGTNNEGGGDPRFQGDHSLLRCLDEKTGQLVWQLTVPKLGSGKVGDWEYLGICSSPAIDGDRVYVLTNRCEVVCLDVHGMKNGNQGLQDEAQYMAGPGSGKTIDVKETDADILWRFDIREELGVYPHNITASSPLVVGDLVYISTSNGVDWGHTHVPSPKSPSFVCLDKKTGELRGEETLKMGERIMHGGWSSPSYGEVNGKGYIVFGGPDGFLYAFEPAPVVREIEGEKVGVLKEAWRYDANPKNYRFKDGDPSKPIKYARPDGPSEFIATPVVHDGKVYAAIGQDPEHGEGLGCLSCVDLATGKPLWTYKDINRSISTCAVTDGTAESHGMAFVADFSGFVYCLDAENGTLHWKHDTMSHIWGSTLVVDGRVYVGNEDGDLNIFEAATAKRQIGQPIHFNDPIYSTPVVANGVILLATQTQLYAIGK